MCYCSDKHVSSYKEEKTGRTERNITGEQEIGEPKDGEALQISLRDGSMDGYNSEINIKHLQFGSSWHKACLFMTVVCQGGYLRLLKYSLHWRGANKLLQCVVFRSSVNRTCFASVMLQCSLS